VESASQATLNRIQKDVKLDQEIEIIQKATETGFEVTTSFIIGFPWESSDDVNRTFDLHCKMLEDGVSRSLISILRPLQGTDLLSNHKVILDRDLSNIDLYNGTDEIPLSDNTKELMHKYPNLFIHMGYFETPNLKKDNLIATQEAAAQINSLHQYFKNI